MRIIIVNNKEEMGKKAASLISSQIILKPDSVLGLATGGTPLGMYKELINLFNKKEIDFKFFPRNNSLLYSVHNHEELPKLIRFSQGFYTAEKWNDTLVFNDLRFGQIIGWHNPKEKFVFHYFLQHAADNRLVVQRGRFAKWNWEIMKSLLKRIKGN